MKVARLLLALSLLSLPLLAASHFGTYTGVVANVPFDFTVGNKIVPAGKCLVQSNNPAGWAILVQNRQAGIDVFSAASAVETRTPAAATTLVFHKYGERYFLTSIRLKNMDTVYQLPESKAELELRVRKGQSAERVLLPL